MTLRMMLLTTTVLSCVATATAQSQDTPTGVVVHGNVFGAGRGLDSDANAAKVGTNATVTISSGHVIGHVYGGGEMASVGNPDEEAVTPSDATDRYGYTTGLATVTINGTAQVGTDENCLGEHATGGYVYGSGLGKAGSAYSDRTYVKNTIVTIGGTAKVRGSVFGSGENGHVRHNTQVNIQEDCEIGTELTTYTDKNGKEVNEHAVDADGQGAIIYRGNVYGGGRGVDHTAGDETHYSLSAGRVKGNTEVNVTGGKIFHDVFGGGSLATVGDATYDDDNNITAYTANTGKATVNISGGVVGYSVNHAIWGKNCGFVYGGCRGLAAQLTDDAVHMAYVHDTEVNISGTAVIKGSVFGGGANGHVQNDTHVNISGGDIGEPLTDDEAFFDAHGLAAITIFRGNVYAGGRGVDHYGDGDEDLSLTAGRVFGNAYLTMTGGHVWHNIYGAGSMASVGTVDRGKNNSIDFLNGEWDAKTGHVTINISGGIVGDDTKAGDEITTTGQTAAKDHAGRNNGRVYGAGRGVSAGRASRMAAMQFVYDTEVNISGTAYIYGAVFGGGENGHVRYDTHVNISGGTIGWPLTDAECQYNPDGTATNPWRGHVFGGGRGVDPMFHNYAAGHSFTAGRVYGNTNVTMTGGLVRRAIYGGGLLASVGNYTMEDASTPGVDIDEDDIQDWAFDETLGDDDKPKNKNGVATITISGGYIGNVNADGSLIEGAGRPGYNNGHVYGSGCGMVADALSHDEQYSQMGYVYRSVVNISQAENKTTVIHGSVFGSGENGHVWENTHVTVNGGTIGHERNNTTDTDQHRFLGNIYGSGRGVDHTAESGELTHISRSAGKVAGNTNITINGGTIWNDVYGGGSMASVGNADEVAQEVSGSTDRYGYTTGMATVKVQGTTQVHGSVYGSGRGIASTNVDYQQAAFIKNSDVQIGGTAHIYSNVYGGGNAGHVRKNTMVTVSGTPTIDGSVYGGGAGSTASTSAGVVYHNVEVNIEGGTIGQNVYGGGAVANSNVHDQDNTNTDNDDCKEQCTTVVNLKGGLIKGDAYGGGEGIWNTTNGDAIVFGDITVTLGEDPNSLPEGVSSPRVTKFDITKYDGKEIVKSGRVFGCNNLNGSPRGDVTVRVWQTVAGNFTRTDITRDATTNEITSKAEPSTYEVAAVYGGGNLASYTATGKKANVIIETCDASIQYVYGGGNAAAVPQTDVLIKGAYEIENVFGGGNGMDNYTLDGGSTWTTNPGANVNGNANTLLTGGYIHEAYGGSNDKGTITGDVTIDVGTGGDCTLDLGKLVGAGKNADVNGDLKIVMGCKPEVKVPLVFGGADNANVNGDVELTITSGNWGTVVGGNNNGGVIRGHIILNIEETTCIPINIDELYGCGYNALYSEYGYYVETNETNGENATGVGAPTETAILTAAGKLHFLPRQSADDPHLPVKTYALNEGNWTWTVYTGEGEDVFTPYASPEVNIISCTHIGQVFGGGYGATATVYGNPTVNINMIPGAHASEITRGEVSGDATALGEIGDVFGGGNQAAVWGNTTVNIATETAVQLHESISREGVYTMSEDKPVTGAYISGNVYGGGNEADVTGNTLVQVCAKEVEGVFQAVPQGTTGVLIAGNVLGGGKGKADTFTCEKAMVGIDGDGIDHPDGGTTVIIGNGTIDGSVYGGGEIGRVEKNTVVTIGLGEGADTEGTATSAPVVKGNVFGAGKGLETHGYAALVRGNPTVTIQGNAKVLKSVYGGGEIASVARYQVVNGVPQALAQVKEGQHSGWCTVNVRGYAEIGPETEMKMYHEGVAEAVDAPDDAGHVFAAGKGVLPENYTYADNANRPRRMMAYDDTKYTTANQAYWEYSDESHANVWEYLPNETKYFEFIQTLALATQTSATISGNALVKGSVYGGSENGLVQYDTNVTIEGNCQIGCGKNTTGRHPAKVWGDSYTVPDDGTDLECASWEYDGTTGAPYDPYAIYKKDGKCYYDEACTNYADGGAKIAKDGHTYYGNVFGGGSGSVPYFDTNKHESRYIMTAGWVKGNTHVTINGGHILTNVYGGCEATNVDGTAYVTMTGGTLGVPRTLAQIDAHPVTCYLFGAGKGDQRVFFNKDTNVKDVVVSITGGRIYGSVFGGGEDGHVLRDVTMTIGQQSTTGEGTEAVTTTSGPTIGTWGTSYVDGNVFGGGRGFGGDAYTAGNVAGSVTMQIKGGTMLGSIYGGGRLGSVGYGLFDAETNEQPTPGYGEMREDTDTEDGFTDGTSNFFTKGRGHIDITISGGTIGNTHEYIMPNATNIAAAGISETDISKWTTDNEWKTWKTYHHISKTEFDTATGRLTHTKGGNVFAGGMGRFYQLDGTTPISVIDWWKLGNVKSTKLTITGGNIKSNVYGGGEQGWTSGYDTADGKKLSTEISITGGTIGTEVAEAVTTGTGSEATTSNIVRYTFGSVFGGGYGSALEKLVDDKGKETNPKFQAGRVKYSTKVDVSGGTVLASVYGGGEVASVGYGFYSYHDDNVIGETPLSSASDAANTYVSVGGNAVIGKAKEGDTYFGGATMGNVYGGGSGNRTIVRCGLILGNTNVSVSGGTIYHNIYGGGAYGSVGDFEYETSIDTQHGTKKVDGVKSLHTAGTGTANISITGGTIGIDGRENGMVFGSSRGDVLGNMQRDDYMAWVNNAIVTIGTSNDNNGPHIRGTVYGSGENGHTFNDTQIDVYSGTIGVTDGLPLTSGGVSYSGAAYPYRGNIYGGGCGTDMYDSNNDGVDDAYNPMAGVVYGNTTVNIHGGKVAHNIYGAGAMGSVGKKDNTGAIVSGGTTNINVSDGTVGVSGTVGDGNIFGAARGDAASTQSGLAQVKETRVTISGGAVKGNVYGGGQAGDVGTYTTDAGGSNIYPEGSGACHVTVTGGTIGSEDNHVTGHVFGAGKGEANTFTCEKAMVSTTHVSIENGTVYGNVYGGGEVGRVENDAEVKIGVSTGEGTLAPDIKGSVYGAGAGLATHGYSALVRHNTTVTVDGNAKVGHSVYGGGEIASVGRYGLDAEKMPSILLGGGECTVTVGSNTVVGEGGTGNIFGACKGVVPHFDKDNADKTLRSRRMTMYTNSTDFPEADKGTKWEYYAEGSPYVWEYYQDEASYATYLETLALATAPTVTVKDNASIHGSVFGGGERGITKGTVAVNIEGGSIADDVYGGGALANTNTTKLVGVFKNGIPEKDGDNNYKTTEVHPTTTVSLTGGTVGGNVYGGGLGQLAKAAVAAQGTEGEEGYMPAQPAVEAVAAKVYGNVLVKLNETTASDNCEVKGNIFGCNNLNGSPQAGVTVHVYKTVAKDESGTVKAKPTKDTNSYELSAVYGGGNLAAYYPDDAPTRATAKANVIIDGCDLTSIQTVYGGGNAASVPETDVVINGTYEVGQAFGGGNGADEYAIDGKTYENPGANVGYMSYAYHTWDGTASKYIAHEYTDADGTDKDASTKERRLANYGTGYGTGKAHVTILGGTVHEVYGGSNTKGNVREESRATLEDAQDNDCAFDVTDAYGGGRNALQDGDAVLDIGCITGLGKAYGGASNADVNGDVELNITNGTYGQVFGGNDMGGCIRGSITVNIEETGCHPVIIGELYGGGNRAAYSVYGYDAENNPLKAGDAGAAATPVKSPVVNVRSFTSIGRIFGGGYGAEATMVASPTVNVNVLKGKYAATEVVADNARVVGSHVVTDPDATGYAAGYPVPSHAADAIGAIHDVFGGGNAAEVVGTTHVHIGTEEYVPMVTIAAGTKVTGYYTRTGSEGSYTYTEITEANAEAAAGTTYYQKVVGADIRGNVFGGGNNAEVTGNTDVVVGHKITTTP